MYDYLGIPLHRIRFLFVFARALSTSQAKSCDAYKPENASDAPGSYFIHASNLHQTPPPWPSSRGFLAHILELLYLIVCHFWFSAICFLVPPVTRQKERSNGKATVVVEGGETFRQYLERIWLPRRYVSHYLLPLMSSVSTCSHDDMLAFPASDVVNYKKLSQGQQHYVVCGGVHQVQSRLAQGVKDVRVSSRVTSVCKDGQSVMVSWQSSQERKSQVQSEAFDKVILAVSADVASRLYNPLSATLSKIPTAHVESSVLSSHLGKYSIVRGTESELSKACAHHDGDKSPSQVITFRTHFGEYGSRTEALHTMPGGMVVSTCPLDADAHSKEILESARFVRTLRTPESRGIVQRIMSRNSGRAKADGKVSISSYDGWVNGEDNVWLAGSWCWDGMVLLEGCVVSAMRVARDLDVQIPW